MKIDVIKRVISDQLEEALPEHYVMRDIEAHLLELAKNKEIIVLSGVRRCGKSVLLQKARSLNVESDYYFNFEDERLIDFTVSDFELLQQVFVELFGEQKTYYFDEIQNIPGWEVFVRRLYNAGCKIFITGSNASLFSEELGTRLTGRHIALQVYPYSFHEYVGLMQPELLTQKALSTKKTGEMNALFKKHKRLGGFPQYIEYEQTDYLQALYDSIIYRDIVARYAIKEVDLLKRLIHYLASNVGKLTTYNALRKLLQKGSATTISDYCHYLENSFLCFFMSGYNKSLKAQIQSPKKFYFIDNALARVVGFRHSMDDGPFLENLVFLELKRRGKAVYYHKGNNECDFITLKNEQVDSAIQVCYSLDDPETKAREIDGLVDALAFYDLKQGYILSEHDPEQKFVHKQDGKEYEIIIQPVWRWLLNFRVKHIQH